MATISYRDLVRALHALGLNSDSNVMAHVALPVTDVRGGVETVIGALLTTCGTVVMPAFTPQTLVWPESGPPDNGCTYGGRAEENARSVMFSSQLAVDPELSPVADGFCHIAQAARSVHPVLSFAAAGAHAQDIVAAQSIEDPLGPVDWLHAHHGDVVLMGADQRANVAIHLAEKLAGRKQFIRWAVGRERAYRLPNFPGCSNGFNAMAGKLAGVAQQASLGSVIFQRIPITDLVEVTVQAIRQDRNALLCDDPHCERCAAVRRAQVAESD